MRSLRLIVLAAWLGAILFFAIGVPQTAFDVLRHVEGGRSLAGDIVGRSLAILHYMGVACAILYVLISKRPPPPTPGASALSMLTPAIPLAARLVLLMMALSIISLGISKRMKMIDSESLYETEAETETARLEFRRLHTASTAAEGIILVLGATALVVESRRRH